MKRFTSILLALTMLLASMSAAFSAQAADISPPSFSTDSGVYVDSNTIVLRSGSLLNTVYYEIYEYGMNNHKGALKQEATKYTLPFKITEPCYIDAWSERGNEMSEIVTNRYYIQYSSDEGRFTVDEDGVLREYTGNSPNLVIPDEVGGTSITSIGENVFSQRYLVSYSSGTWDNNNDDYSNYLESVTLPDSCTEIQAGAFGGCINLQSVSGGNVKTIGDRAFQYCDSLESFDFSTVETVGRAAFQYARSLKALESDSIKTIETNAFLGEGFDRVDLPNLETMDEWAITNSKYINVGKLKTLKGKDQYSGTMYFRTLVAPNMTEIESNAIACRNYDNPKVFAPKLAGALGGSIRLSDSGLRFGFNWDNGTDFQAAHGDNVEYGFVYAYERTDDLTVENGKTKVAEKRTDSGGKTSFNLVFTNIPKDNYDTEISARAYVCIDGVYFYSDILTRSFSGVAQAVLNDPTVDEAIKAQLQQILEA